ncbi:hypothetical protein GY45DRAFT_563487 [Cubamyces sp. BRFM 1775]|nr:hypothetical protein GY45DRAFT_563487 [Cubamyces sp. BRFM 1775]
MSRLGAPCSGPFARQACIRAVLPLAPDARCSFRSSSLTCLFTSLVELQLAGDALALSSANAPTTPHGRASAPTNRLVPHLLAPRCRLVSRPI